MNLLVGLSWLLVFIAIILSGAVLTSILSKQPKLVKWSSLIAVTFGFLSVLVVIFTTGYLWMKLQARKHEQERCSELELKRMDGNSTRNDERHSELTLIFNYLLGSFPEAEKWAKWVAVGLCGMAVLAFIVLIALLMKSEKKKIFGKIPPSDIPYTKEKLNDMHEADYTDYEKKKIPISCISYPKYTLSSDFKKAPSLPHIWASYTALGLLGIAVIGFVLLNYSYGAVKESILSPCLGYEALSKKLEENNSIKSLAEKQFLPSRIFFTPRKEWIAKPATSMTSLTHPVEYVVVSHTRNVPCHSRKECIQEIQKIQRSAMEMEGWWDIVYNFLVAGDLRVYEGRGWDVAGPKASQYRNGSLEMGFVGTFKHELPPAYQIRSFKRLVDEGIRLGKISPGYKLVVDRNTQGSMLHKKMQTSNHWFDEE